ncbi:MAG: hypothetical protein Q8R02_02675 [Hyphomonadaceae bacterium]|nr:hypothetical protein [Hyphomonadaceae bacterium]
MRDARMMGSWVLALFLMAMFLWIADQSLFPGEGRNIVFPMLAEKSEYYLFEPTGRLAVSLLEVLAALLILIPWTRRLGAILGALIAAGALAAQFVWIGMALPTPDGKTDGGGLFYLTLALLVASLVLAVVHPGRSGGNASGPQSYYGR